MTIEDHKKVLNQWQIRSQLLHLVSNNNSSTSRKVMANKNKEETF